MDLDVAESGTWWIGVRGDVEALENGVLEEVVYLELDCCVWGGWRRDLGLWNIGSCLRPRLRSMY